MKCNVIEYLLIFNTGIIRVSFFQLGCLSAVRDGGDGI